MFIERKMAVNLLELPTPLQMPQGPLFFIIFVFIARTQCPHGT